MRRALLALVTTVAGLVVLLGFRTTPLPTTAAGVGATSTQAAADQPGTTTATGARVETEYGPVQVQVTVDDVDGSLASVTPVSLPADEPRSAELSARAAPALAQEAIDAQSAAIDMVSGATYTSRGYAQSLQSALDQVPAPATTGRD